MKKFIIIYIVLFVIAILINYYFNILEINNFGELLVVSPYFLFSLAVFTIFLLLTHGILKKLKNNHNKEREKLKKVSPTGFFWILVSSIWIFLITKEEMNALSIFWNIFLLTLFISMGLMILSSYLNDKNTHEERRIIKNKND